MAVPVLFLSTWDLTCFDLSSLISKVRKLELINGRKTTSPRAGLEPMYWVTDTLLIAQLHCDIVY